MASHWVFQILIVLVFRDRILSLSYEQFYEQSLGV